MFIGKFHYGHRRVAFLSASGLVGGHCGVLGILVATFLTASAQNVGVAAISALPQNMGSSPYLVADRGANYRVWQQSTYDSLPNGVIVTNVHSYTEIASGLNHLVNGQWVESSEAITILPNGTAAATNGQHQAYFPGNIYQGQIQLVTPEGKNLVSRPLGLAYFDGTNTVLIAQLTNSIGYVTSTNQVIYPNAFTGFKVDLRYTYTRSGFEQDVILRQQPPTPESFGLNPVTTRLQILTEFFDPPQPAVESAALPAQAGISLTDQTLGFGSTRMVQGRAFLMGTNGADAGAQVAKHWVQASDRQFLIEEVPIDAILQGLAALPMTAMDSGSGNASRIASTKLQLPPSRMVKHDHSKLMRLAKMETTRPSLVLDYQTINSSYTGYFQGDTTYYISGPVNFYGTITFEGGAVLKYATNGSLNITTGNPPNLPGINWQAGAYQPVIFTAKDDNTVGETISGSSGSPMTNYGTPMLGCAGFSAPLTLRNARFCYAGVAIQLSAMTAGVYSAQFVKCQTGFNLVDGSLLLGNALFANTKTNFLFQGGFTVNAQNVTFGSSTFLAVNPANSGGDSIYLTNCILATCVYFFTGTFNAATGDFNGFYNNNSTPFGNSQLTSQGSPFQAVGSGYYYLASTCGFYQQGSPNVDSTVLAELARKTTRQPSVLTQNFPTGSIRTPNASVVRDNSGTPDLGYHYDTLDYCWTGLQIASDLTLANGVAVGFYGSSGLNGGTSLTSQGTALNHNTLTLYSTVQEQPQLWGSRSSANYLLNANPSKLTMRFTDLLLGGVSSEYLCSGTAFNMNIWDSQWLAVKLSNTYAAYSGLTLGFTNNIFQRCALSFATCGSAYAVNFRNNLFLYGSLNFGLCSQNYNLYQLVTIEDNLFVTNSFSYQSYVGYGPRDIAYNGYAGTTVLHGTAPSGYGPPVSGGDVTVPTLDFQPGAFGNYYYPASGGNLFKLVDAGNMTAGAAGLVNYTTQTSLTPDAGTVDIGFHYPIVGSFGTDFWIAFPNAYNNGSALSIYICGAPGTIGSVSVPLLNQVNNFTVPSSGLYTMSLDPGVMEQNYDTIENYGINISANSPVTVYAVNYSSATTESYTAFPTTMLGTQYCLLARSYATTQNNSAVVRTGVMPLGGGGSGYASQFTVVATGDNTTIHITPSGTADLDSPNGGLWENPILLMKGQTYQINSIYYSDDVTGTLVTSDKPIALFAGVYDAYVPYSGLTADNPIAQEQFPVDSWRNNFIGYSFAGRLNGTSYRVLALYNNTSVTVSGIEPGTSQYGVINTISLNGQQFYDLIVDGPIQFQANLPIQVAQFANSASFDGPENKQGDPNFILLPPVGEWPNTNTFVVLPDDFVTGDFTANYVNIIVSQSGLNGTFLDSTQLLPANFTEIGATGYYETQIPNAQIGSLSLGLHKVTGTQPAFVESYGFGQTDAYGFFSGIITK